jgi:hypothetical protein
MANNKYKTPEELNWFDIYDILEGIERHYNEKNWDVSKSSRHKELFDYCVKNADKLFEDVEHEYDYLAPTGLWWKVVTAVYGFDKRDTTIKEKGGDDARLLH